jgi:hypothetical protein
MHAGYRTLLSELYSKIGEDELAIETMKPLGGHLSSLVQHQISLSEERLRRAQEKSERLRAQSEETESQTLSLIQKSRKRKSVKITKESISAPLSDSDLK